MRAFCMVSYGRTAGPTSPIATAVLEDGGVVALEAMVQSPSELTEANLRVNPPLFQDSTTVHLCLAPTQSRSILLTISMPSFSMSNLSLL